MELFKNDPKQNPQPGVFEFISKSFLKTMVKDPTAAVAINAEETPDPNDKQTSSKETIKFNRDNWVPLGDVGSTIFADQFRPQFVPAAAVLNPNNPNPAPRVVPQTRIEFVILFVWKEPLPSYTPLLPMPPTAPAADAKK